MPRQVREISESGTYHIMLRGINQVQLFYDEEDRRAFLERLSKYKAECTFALFAWCLMGNHIHLLIREGAVRRPIIMQKLTLSYSYYFRAKYDRCGNLFQDRYQCKPVDTDKYLLAVVRYIHRNPLEIGEPMSSWTSYNDYLTSSELTDTALVLGMLSVNAERSRLAFKEFVESADGDELPSVDEQRSSHIRDAEAIELILRISGFSSCTELCNSEKSERDKLIIVFRKHGLSIRQIARLTGISRGIISDRGTGSLFG